MTHKIEILARFSGEGGDDPFYLPDLTLWYDWHQKRNSFPERWQGDSLAQVARAMGVPIWLPARPWRVEHPGLVITRTEANDERVIQIDILIMKTTTSGSGTRKRFYRCSWYIMCIS